MPKRSSILRSSLANASVTAAATLGGLCVSAVADTLIVTTIDDNTLIEDSGGAWSSGASLNFYAGRVGPNGESKLRRGVIKFDVAAIPVGSTIQSVTVKLYCSKSGSGSAFVVNLKRLTQSFGEGSSFSFGGGGSPPSIGDATWIHRSYPNLYWTVPGGDFVAAASASKSVSGTGPYTWTSTPLLVSDVQGWVNNSAVNYGWLVQGNEVTLQSVKRFDTHEAAASTQPILTVTYAPPAPMIGDLNGDLKVNGADLAILLGQWGASGSGDFDASGAVNGADLGTLLGGWTG